jgi:two-component system invasion response regulator UvrY
MTTVALASTLKLLREGMKRVIDAHSDLRVTAEYNCAEDIFANCSIADGHVLVIATPLQDLSQKMLREIKENLPAVGIVFITDTRSVQRVMQNLTADARGILMAHSPAGNLPCAIRAVAAGRVYADKALVDLIANDSSLTFSRSFSLELSHRESEILIGIASGETNTQIANRLSISPKTVSTHKKNIMEKTGSGSVPEIVQYAIEHNLVHASEIFDVQHLCAMQIDSRIEPHIGRID